MMDELCFSHAVPYEAATGRKDGTKRPQLRVRLHHGTTTSPPILALVDSGADVSTFHLGIARNMGIDLVQCRPVTLHGVGGVEHAHACRIDVELAGRLIPVEVRFVSTVIALLGRHDVFTHFRFAFDQRAELLYVDPY